jgi:hypothetical protein
MKVEDEVNDEIGWICSRMINNKCMKILAGKLPGKRCHLGDLGINGST